MTLETAYDEALYQDNFPAGVENHFWFRARNRIIDGELREAVRRGLLPDTPKILDVGCGPGIVTAAMLARGHDIWGVEIGRPTPLPAARERIARGQSAADLPAATRARFDALLFLDVVEHVPDDAALLRDTLAAFPACRCVIVTVPARQEVWSSHDTHYGHYRRYTPATLETGLKAAGLRPDRMRYLFRGLYGAAALMKLAGRDRDPVMRTPRHLRLHGWLAAGLCLEDALLHRLPLPGLSLLAAARVTTAPG